MELLVSNFTVAYKNLPGGTEENRRGQWMVFTSIYDPGAIRTLSSAVDNAVRIGDVPFQQVLLCLERPMSYIDECLSTERAI
jgi:hypothetical protein